MICRKTLIATTTIPQRLGEVEISAVRAPCHGYPAAQHPLDAWAVQEVCKMQHPLCPRLISHDQCLISLGTTICHGPFPVGGDFRMSDGISLKLITHIIQSLDCFQGPER